MIVLNQRDSKNWLYLKVNLFCPPAFRKVSLSCLQIPSVAANSCSGLWHWAQCIAVVAVSLNLPNSPVRHILLGFFCLFGFGGGGLLFVLTPHAACRVLFLRALQWTCGVLSTGLPRKSRGTFYCYPHFLMRKPQKSSVTCPGSPSLSPDNSRDPQAVRLRTCLCLAICSVEGGVWGDVWRHVFGCHPTGEPHIPS